MWLNISDDDFGLVVGAVEQLRAAAVLMDVHDELREGLDRLVSDLNDPGRCVVIKKYRALHDAVSEIVESGCLRELEVASPRIYKGLVDLLAEVAGLDPDTVDAP